MKLLVISLPIKTKLAARMADAWPIGSDGSTLAHHHIHRCRRHCIPTQSFKILESDFWTATAASGNMYLEPWVRQILVIYQDCRIYLPHL